MSYRGLLQARGAATGLLAIAALTMAGIPFARDGVELEDAQQSVLRCEAAKTAALTEQALYVTVSGGTERDHDFACIAVRRAVAFFHDQGLTPDLHVQIAFQEVVQLELPGGSSMEGVDLARITRPATSGANLASSEIADSPLVERVAGHFDKESRVVHMTTEASGWLRSYSYFGLTVNDEMLVSMLTHEVSHALSPSLYAATMRPREVDIHVQQEYLAYAVQISTMSHKLRAAVLGNFPAEAHRFNEEADINALSLAFSPEAFGVESYRHFIGESGGLDFLQRMFSGRFQPSHIYLY
jgi:hypothetical protein